MPQKAAARDRALIDQEHRALGKLIDALQAAINRGESEEDIEQRKAALLSRLEEHLDLEKRIMIDAGFPLIFAHLEAHDSFRDQIKLILSSIHTAVINKGNISRLLKKTHEHHVRYYDDILTFYLVDKYSLEAVDDGLGI
jgi:hemerythrin-like metal-binding protein